MRETDFAAALGEADLPVPEGLEGPSGEIAGKRFDIYRNNVSTGMISALGATFPAVRRLVGEEFFAALARAFIRHQPPTSPLLFAYGAGFADFIAGFPPAQSVPYLADVARLEWSYLNAYHAADAETSSLRAFASLPQDKLDGVRFSLHPSLRIVQSSFAIVSIWADVTERFGEHGRQIDARRAENAMIVRPQLAVDIHTISDTTVTFVETLGAGEPLGVAVHSAMKSGSFNLSEELASMFERGVVTGLSIPEPEAV